MSEPAAVTGQGGSTALRALTGARGVRPVRGAGG
jgi:hypothetical protein